jgi:hypothetical protein
LEGAETVLSLLEGNSLGSGCWVTSPGGHKRLGGDIDAYIEMIVACHRSRSSRYLRE